jgi:pilus assembly protein CpaB
VKRSKGIVIAGAILALLGMVSSYLYTRSAKSETAAATAGPKGKSTAWVALEDLQLGSTWDQMAALVSQQAVPLTLKPALAINKPVEVDGKTLVRNVAKGEVITSTHFNATGVESLSIPEGTSALTVSLPHPQGVGDYIQPGSKANIFVTLKGDPSASGGVLTKLLLSDVTVLSNRRALPAKTVAEGEPATTGGSEVLLTFAVTVDQAERIIFAKENGALWLTLMRPGAPADQGIGRTFTTLLP